MRFVRYNGGDGPAWGVHTDDGIHVLGDLPSGEPSYQDLAADSYLVWLADHVEKGTLSTVDSDDVSFLAPAPRPPNNRLCGAQLP